MTRSGSLAARIAARVFAARVFAARVFTARVFAARVFAARVFAARVFAARVFDANEQKEKKTLAPWLARKRRTVRPQSRLAPLTYLAARSLARPCPKLTGRFVRPYPLTRTYPLRRRGLGVE